MNWDAIGAVGEILGAVSVLITLMYLATQVNEAKRSTRAQIENAVLSSWAEAVEKLGGTKERAELMLRGLNNYSALVPEERLVFHTVLDSFVVEYQRQHNLYDDGGWEWKNRAEIENAVVMAIGSPGGKRWWDEARMFYMHRERLDKLLSAKDELPALTDLSMFRGVE